MTEDSRVQGGGSIDPALGPSQFTVVVSATPPTSASGAIVVDRVGVDQGGNIWLFYPRTYTGSAWVGGWTYAATITSGGLPLVAGGTNVEGGGRATPES